MCLAFGVERLDDVAAKLDEVLELHAAAGARRQGARSSARSSRSRTRCRRRSRRRACQEVVLTGDDVDLDLLPIQRCWPLDPAPFITLPGGDHPGPRDGRAQRRHVPDAEDRPALDLHALADPQGRPRRPARRPRRRGSRSPSRSGSTPSPPTRRARRCPKHVGELMVAGFLKGSAVQLVQCKTVDLEVPANAEIVLEGWVDASDIGIEGPFGDHTGFYTPAGGVPALPPQRDHDAPRRDLPVDRRRQAAGRGRVAREGDRADLPAGDPDERPRDRRLRPADRRRVPQLRDRLDPQALPGSRAEGDARDLGPRAAVACRSRSSSSTSTSTCTTTRRSSSTSAPTSTRSATSLLADGPIDQLDHASTLPVARRQDRLRRDRQGPGRGRARVAARDRDERRDPGAGRRALGRARVARAPPSTDRAEWAPRRPGGADRRWPVRR